MTNTGPREDHEWLQGLWLRTPEIHGITDRNGCVWGIMKEHLWGGKLVKYVLDVYGEKTSK